MDQGICFELILASNYLDIKSLLDITSQTANLINGKNQTPEEICKYFKIKNNLTQEEEVLVFKEK